MHDIWNPWHGCRKKSEGCDNCYMFYLDRKNGNNGSNIYKVKNNFDYPLHKDRQGRYKIKSGEMIRICMTSDFFLEEADSYRNEVWEIIKKRQDVKFFILTKRPERVKDNLPSWWGEGLENVIFNVTTENQKRADERIPILKQLPFKHKGIMVAPFIGKVSIDEYLKDGFIEQVIAGGENYDGSRVLRYEWVKSLSDECKKYDVNFCFIETGNKFLKDKKIYLMKDKSIQSTFAYKLNLNHIRKKIHYKLYNEAGRELRDEELYVPYFSHRCSTCSSKMICNGCSKCEKCEKH